jgi:hypothetical protein
MKKGPSHLIPSISFHKESIFTLETSLLLSADKGLKLLVALRESRRNAHPSKPQR